MFSSITSSFNGMREWASRRSAEVDDEMAEWAFEELAKIRQTPHSLQILSREELACFESSGEYAFFQWSRSLPLSERKAFLDLFEKGEAFSFLENLKTDRSFFNNFQEIYLDMRNLAGDKPSLSQFIKLYNEDPTAFIEALQNIQRAESEEIFIALLTTLKVFVLEFEEESPTAASSFFTLSKNLARVGAWEVFNKARNVARLIPIETKELSPEEREQERERIEQVLESHPYANMDTSEEVTDAAKAFVSQVVDHGSRLLEKGKELLDQASEELIRKAEEIFAKKIVEQMETAPKMVFKLKQNLVRLDPKTEFMKSPIDYIVTTVVNFIKRFLSSAVFSVVDNVIETVLDPTMLRVFIGRTMESVSDIIQDYEQGMIPEVSEEEKEKLINSLNKTILGHPTVLKNISTFKKISLKAGAEQVNLGNVIYASALEKAQELLQPPFIKEGETEETRKALEKALTHKIMESLLFSLSPVKNPPETDAYIQKQAVRLVQTLYTTKRMQQALTSEEIGGETNQLIGALSIDLIKSEAFENAFNKLVRVSNHIDNLSSKTKDHLHGIQEKKEKVFLPRRIVNYISRKIGNWLTQNLPPEEPSSLPSFSSFQRSVGNYLVENPHSLASEGWNELTEAGMNPF